jgi:hypothetical protein
VATKRHPNGTQKSKPATTELAAHDLTLLTERWEKDGDIIALGDLLEAGVWPEDFSVRIRLAVATFNEKGTNPSLADLLVSGRRRGRHANPRTRTLHLRSREAIHAVLVGVRRAGWKGGVRFERAEAWFAERGTALGIYAARPDLRDLRVQHLADQYYRHLHHRPLLGDDRWGLSRLVEVTIPRGPDRPEPIVEEDPSRPGWRWTQFPAFDPVTERWSYLKRVAVGPVRAVRRKSH